MLKQLTVKMWQSLIFTLDKWSDLFLTGCVCVVTAPPACVELDDWLMRNFLRNAHPLEKREKLGQHSDSQVDPWHDLFSVCWHFRNGRTWTKNWGRRKKWRGGCVFVCMCVWGGGFSDGWGLLLLHLQRTQLWGAVKYTQTSRLLQTSLPGTRPHIPLVQLWHMITARQYMWEPNALH